ncbi:myb-like protein V isoform X2 [Orussus abietinus]|uniref:myb-like protein V isoform X2 n=1 Tax=Orussus abietinus TaxID=222816 RepID=UPI0006257EF0|nr:myb-like protein V isoform X2 [Orussus abietinus]
MQRKDLDGLLAVNETVLRANLLKGPRLTPTGKISHAKTRVYTQRYRKEWELMLDFKGWLTSVPLQPTRAYCTYCKKDLHAHRLSLLKHTCTMKHQRSALMHQNEMNALKAKQEMSKVEASMGEHDENEGHMVISGKEGDEDNDDDIEYVVERLDVDDEEIEEIQRKHKEEQVTEEEEEEEEMLRPSEDEDIKPSIQSIKEERCRDTLAEAMAHVQGEYLEETDDQMNVELVEMVVESTQANQDLIPEERNDHTDMVVEEEEEEEEEDDRLEQHEISLGKKESDDHEKSFEDVESSEQETNIYQSVGKTNTSFKVNPVNQQQGLPISMTSLSNKTITLTSVGKTLTLAGGKLTPGAQYVLGKMKGKMPTLVMANRKPITVVNLADVSPKAAPVKIVQQPVTTGPIQQSSKKHIILKSIKSPTAQKPCISTHVLDTSKGLPISGLQVSLYKLMDGRWTFLNESITTPNGHCNDLGDPTKWNFTAGRYKIHFDVDKYFTLRRIETMYPFIEIVFDVKNPTNHYHMPVLLSPFGYTTYRGSDW